MKNVGIDDLPKYSPWVSRLLGLEQFNNFKRDLAKIDAEYDKDKYARLLKFYEEESDASIEDIKYHETIGDRGTICISQESRLFLTAGDDYFKLERDILTDTIGKYITGASTVVELGCGYGYNLSVLKDHYPNVRCSGGEYSRNAVRLANHLFAAQSDIQVMPFNWYDDSWELFEQLDGKALVFTRHSIEQLPIVSKVLPTFKKYRDKITGVLHLEPIGELITEVSTLGLLRRAYIQMNDYNTDLLLTLKKMKVEIIDTRYDIIGGNPLNPTSLIYWQF